MLGVLNVSSLNLAPAAGSFPFPPKYITLPSGKKEILGIEQGGLQQKSSPVPSNLNGTFPVKRVEGSSEPVSPLSVSALHAEVWFQNGKIYIRDLDSPFGTFINDVKVQPGQEIALRRGDTLLPTYDHVRLHLACSSSSTILAAMALEHPELNMSSLSINSSGSLSEDWDRSLTMDEEPTSTHGPSPSDTSMSASTSSSAAPVMTPRNSVVFPVENDTTPRRSGQNGHAREASGGQVYAKRDKRSLSELMRLHAEKGTDCNFSPEEASRVGEVLGQWINASSSPYEGDDDFFRSHDDLTSVLSRRAAQPGSNGRPRGQSESFLQS
ncbi:hypothetical protein ONZ45_g8360 [Pleurotus djamor]|nr:hypothetical protein ONZ45_g8360 [Pleurotus djamor]